MLSHFHGFVSIVPSLIWLVNYLFFTVHFRSFNKITTKNHGHFHNEAPSDYPSCLPLCSIIVVSGITTMMMSTSKFSQNVLILNI